MENKLRILEELRSQYVDDKSRLDQGDYSAEVFCAYLKQEAIETFKNLQSNETIYPILLRNFPETSKGSIAKGMWDDNNFRYGAEYGMLAMLMYFFNITKEDLKHDAHEKKDERGAQ